MCYALTLLLFLTTLNNTSAQFRNLVNDVRQTLGASNIKDTRNFRQSYDFIVIGAGSGGSVVANRLTENPEWSVLLLEAGNDETLLTDVPLMAPVLAGTSFFWDFKSVKMKSACLSFHDTRCKMGRGRGLGGTSIINFMLYTRGNKLDYDEWARFGNQGWSYEEVLPYFIKSENCTKCRNIDWKYHGTSGYLNIEHPGYETPLVQAFIKSGEDLGYSNVDVNGKSGIGFSKVFATMENGRRCSASKAFLHPVSHRPNLHISMGARVTKILIDPVTKQAHGVEFLKSRQKYKIYATKEVILSAGTTNSPHLLMLSGIGPREDLRRVNIPVIQNLKVGYNLQNHMSMNTLVFLVNETITVSDRSVQNGADVFNYVFNGKGPYTLPAGAEALGFMQTKFAEVWDYPDIELVLSAGALNGDSYGNLRRLVGIPQSLYNTVYAPHANTPGFSIVPVVMRPKSRGRVIINSANPLRWPTLEPNFFQNEEDVSVLVEGIKMAISITQSRHFQRYNTTLNPIPFPRCSNLLFGSDEYWACAVRHVAISMGHQVGTCKMGPASDSEAVVDPELKVHGIKGLRVVDGSVMPNVVAGHTNAVIMMIGEKASDMIKKDWEK